MHVPSPLLEVPLSFFRYWYLISSDFLLPRGREKCSFPRGKIGRSVNLLTPKVHKNEDKEFGIISGGNPEFYMLCWVIEKAATV